MEEERTLSDIALFKMSKCLMKSLFIENKITQDEYELSLTRLKEIYNIYDF